MKGDEGEGVRGGKDGLNAACSLALCLLNWVAGTLGVCEYCGSESSSDG